MATEFNQDFIERRMAEHARWRHDEEAAMTQEIIDEVQELPYRKPRRNPSSGHLFPAHSRLAVHGLFAGQRA